MIGDTRDKTGAMLFAVAAACSLAACSSEPPEAGTVPDRIFRVETARVTAQDVAVTLSAVGNVEASERAEVRPQVDGVIAEIGFEDGGRVEAGDLLVKLDDRKAAAQLALAGASVDSAAAKLAMAEQRMRRHESLIAEELVSRQRFEEVEAEFLAMRAALAEAEAALTLADRQFDDFYLRAPFAGVVGAKLADPGNYVRAGELLVTLMKTDPVEISFGLPDRHATRLRTGIKLEVSTAGAASVQGRVSFIDPKVDTATRMLRLKARIPNAAGTLKPGQFAEVTVLFDARSSQVVIPEEAVVSFEGKSWVFVIRGNTAERRLVELGTRMPGRVEVLAGLRAGEEVIVGGQHRLHDGDRVQNVSAPPGT